jgi:phage virion morphogenesis protein
MAEGVAIKVDWSDVTFVLGSLAGRLDDQRGMWDEIGAALETSARIRITDTNRAPDGNPWPPSLRARLTGGKTLYKSGDLQRSITHNVLSNGVEIGTDLAYARIHQLGGTIKREARMQTIYRRYNPKTDELSHRFVKKRESNFATDHQV